ncbi:PQQ-like beta-propeller repeat protein [Membranihabitans maritimus]|uniref:PQQ-like beta-propeller repeat protein n=1 Tax=Membranihabitans maritimus TaxID=2904244 RepID=UPI001F188C4F|nr:PQQ-like beta-propeller repeat protein [Membranihabitans maritimus]
MWKRKIESSSNIAIYNASNVYIDSLFVHLGESEMYGLDLETGLLAYKVNLGRNIESEPSDLPLLKDKTILRKNHLKASIIDIRSGTKIGEVNNVLVPYSGIIPHKGLFYFANGERLISLDPENLEVVWSFMSRNYNNSVFSRFPVDNGIVIDWDNDLLFTTDLRNVICVDLPE